MKRIIVSTLGLLILFSFAIQAEENSTEKLYYENRDEIPVEYTWNLQDIFPDDAAWNKEFAEVEKLIEDFGKYKGTLAESPEQLAGALDAMFKLMERENEIQVYAYQKFHSNTKNAEAGELSTRESGLVTSMFQAISFVDPEISQIPDDVLAKYRKKKIVKPYNHYIDNIIRKKKHIRDAEIEEVLASAGLLAGAPQRTWAAMTQSDIVWPIIKDENGEDAKVTPALYYSFVANQDRRIRQEAALALFGKYSQFANTFAATYGAHVQRDIFYARNRNYNTSLEMALNEVNVPEAVVKTLINTVHDNFDLMHRYATLRKKVLGVDEFHIYDMYVSLVSEGDKKVTYEEAKQIALDFWKDTYGQEYYEVGKKAFDERWIDVYGNEGKRGGAYSWGTFNSHPYMLLNWGGTMEDVFTLVHEMGHSIHTYMANKYQPYQYSDYTLFVAEVASVTSEALFLDYMLDRTEDPTERLFLLNLYINNITGTFLRQIFFTEFEVKAHEMAEAGQPLTAKTMGEVYGKLWQDYYGPDLVVDEEFEAGWARISHYYRTFYVYVYASSFAAGESIASRVREGDKGAVQDYLDMLKLGGSVYPMETLAKAKVDMTDPSVIQTVMKRYEETLIEMEKLLLK